MSYLVTDTEAGAYFLCSAILLLFGFYFLLIYNKRHKYNALSFEKRIMIFSGFLLASTWLMRFMVGASGVLTEESAAPLTKLEELFNSLIHALQSFSLDEGYTDFITGGKQLMTGLFPKAPFMAVLYSVYASIQNVICPIAGGAILFAILTTIFPRVKLWFLSLQRWRPICYFSELNDTSLALAMSIRSSTGRYSKALMVFTDVYTDSDDEDVSERIQKAKNIGSICLQDDISTISISGRKNKMFFLMDQNEVGNLQTLTCFTEEKQYSKLDGSDQIYLFGHGDSDQMVVRNVRDTLSEAIGEERLPKIIPVKGYQHLVYNLLREKPLFSAVDRDRGDKRLKITIFGSGSIGTEMFLAVYWCGQLLDFELNVTVVSNEAEDKFRSRIDHINPEIFRSSEPEDEMLQIYSDSETPRSPVYFRFSYVCTDIQQDDLYKKITKEKAKARIIDSDYFVVALGSDEDNFETADMLSRMVTLSKLKNTASTYMPVVAFVIYDDALNNTLKRRASDSGYAVEMVPFGSMSETYNYSTVIFDGIRESADTINDAYLKEICKTMTSESSLKKLYSDQYTYWANISKAIHIQYKAFSAGMDIEAYERAAKDPDSALANDARLAWLEHRRWNAFMRSRGFRAPTIEEEKAYIGRLPDNQPNGGKHKNLQLKLHPCLVECDQHGMKEDVFSPHTEKDDLLDEVSIRIKNNYKSKQLGGYDFKKFDYPKSDFS